MRAIMTRKLNKAQLQELVNSLAWNDGYGCYTRAGFEKLIWPTIADQAKWIIFFDVDDMHGLNSEHGYEGVNELIKKSLAMRASDFMAGQWFSGDEFIVCITDDPDRGISDPMSFCERLAEDFRQNGAPATFGIAEVTSRNLFENVGPAHRLVQVAKSENRRGSIEMVGG